MFMIIYVMLIIVVSYNLCSFLNCYFFTAGNSYN